MSVHRIAAGVIAAGLVTSSAPAAVLINQNFDSAADGSFPFGSGTGSGGSLDRFENNGGTINVTSAVFSGASGKSAVIKDNSPANGNASALYGTLPTINSGGVDVSFQFQAVTNDSYSLFNFGGGHNFNTAASQLVAIDGVFAVKYGNGTSTLQSINVGTYAAGQFYTVHYLFNVDAKTFNLDINGTRVSTGLSFQDGYATYSPAAGAVGNFSTSGNVAFELDSDAKPIDRAGAPVMYIDNVVFQSVAVPEPTTLALGALAVIPVLHRRRREI